MTSHRAATEDAHATASAAAAELLRAADVSECTAAVVLGSGWGAAADALGETRYETSTADLPGFAPPSAPGHGGRVRVVERDGTFVLVFLGRTHLYEGRGVAAVAHGVRVAAAAGCRTVVLTNAAGGVRPSYTVGEPVLIRDHLNLTASSPVDGATFVDLTECYSHELRELAHDVDPSLFEGVYAGFVGPHFETPAEVEMVSRLGGDLVGMSTVLEAIAAREAGLEVLGISLVSNLAAGVADIPLSGDDVIAAAQAAMPRLAALLDGIVGRLAARAAGPAQSAESAGSAAAAGSAGAAGSAETGPAGTGPAGATE